MIRLILAVGLLGFAYYGYHRINALPPERRKQMWWKLALGGLIVISVIAVATGRMHWLGGALALLLAAVKFGAHTLLRVWPLLRATGQDAVFRTEHLEVRFIVKTSQLQGSVIKGRYQGEALQSMTVEQLQELADLYQNEDRKSWYLVRVFMQRSGATQGNFQNQQQQTAGGFPSSPTREEALLILGLQGKPDKPEIIAAHRKLIQKLHPDRGGNDYLAARVNQAKDVLLG